MSFLTHLPLPPMPHSLQVTKHNIPIIDAMSYTGATHQVRVIRRRVDRYKERMRNIILSLPKTPASSVPLSTNSPSPHQQSSPVTSGTALGSRKSPKQNVSRGIDSEICIVKKAREDALDKIPGWLDRGKTAGALSKRKKRPTAKVNRDNFTERAENTAKKSLREFGRMQQTSTTQIYLGQRKGRGVSELRP